MHDLLNDLIGRKCVSLSFDTPTEEWIFKFGDRFVLQTASPWRIVEKGAIRLGWRDDGHQFGLPNPVNASSRALALLNAPIESTNTSSGTGDLQISFGEACRLEVFNDSSGYEGWIVNGPDGEYTAAQGGGKIVEGRRADV